MTGGRAAVVIALAVGAVAAVAQERSEGAGVLRVRYEGNAGLDAAALDEILRPERVRYIDSGRSRGVLDDAAFVIEREYRRIGFRDVEVTYEVADAAGDEILFRIVEGPVWTTDGPLVFEPAIAVAGFADFWQRTSIYAPRRLMTTYPVYIENRLLNDLQLAKDYLIEKGYRAVRFDVERTIDEARHRIGLRVAVDLGPRSLVRRVDFEGDLLFEPAVVRAAMGLEPWPSTPVPYFVDRAIKWKIAIVRFYRSKGYYRPLVEPLEPVVEPRGRVEEAIDLVFRVDPGRRFKVGEVRVTGNEHVSDAVVREVFDVEPGEWYSARRIDEGRADLISLDLFAVVTILEEEVGEEELVVVVDVEEKPSKFLGLQVGFGLFELFRAGGEFQWSNLAGTEWGFRVEGSVSDTRRRLDLQLIDPLPFGDGANELALGPFVERQEREPFVLHRWGGALSFDRQQGDLRLDLGWTFERSDLRHLGDGLALSGEGDQVFNGPRIGFVWDVRNDPINPTAGYEIAAHVETTLKGLGSTKDLLGAGARVGLYYPVATFQGYPVVVYAGLRFGLVQPILGAEVVPIQKRLFEGGEDSVRSFEPDRFGPVNFLDVPIGGEVAFVGSVECRFNIWKDLWGVVFTDVGLVDSNLEEFGQEDPGWAVGAGLRYLTPIGPIRLEVAANPEGKRTRDDELFELVFTIGFRF